MRRIIQAIISFFRAALSVRPKYPGKNTPDGRIDLPFPVEKNSGGQAHHEEKSWQAPERKASDVTRAGGATPSGKSASLRKKAREQTSPDPFDGAEARIQREIGSRYGFDNHLGKAAEFKKAAKAAIKERRLDDAWGLLHQQKSEWLAHGQKQGFDERGIIALDGSASEDLANILRIEGKHDQALTHLMYAACSSKTMTKAIQNKLQSYFKRCKFEGMSEADFNRAVKAFRSQPDFRGIQEVVNGWRQDGYG